MRTTITALSLLSTLLFSSPTLASSSSNTSTFCISHAVSPTQQNQIWDAFVQDFYIHKQVADSFHRYVVADYISHTATSGSGAEFNVQHLAAGWPALDIQIHHLSSVEQNIGWVHYRIQREPVFPNETAIVDLFRFNGSCIVEHWDVIESVNNATTNPVALF